MAKPWFRLYRALVDNPKVQALRPDLFKAWVNILCCTDDDGVFPDMRVLCFKLRKSEAIVSKWFSELQALGFIVDNKAHDWREHQFQSDVSTERVKRFRERSTKRSGNAERNAPETETDTETDITLDKSSVDARERTRPTKGSRWPADAVVPDDWIRDAARKRHDHRLPELNLTLAAERFANFWSAEGKTKRDWKRTWINWALSEKGPRHDTAKPTQLEQLASIARADTVFDE